MASKDKGTSKPRVAGETLVAWQKYSAKESDELTLKEGDVVELIDTKDPQSDAKRIKLDCELDQISGQLLDTSAAHHKLSVRPRRKHASSRHSPTRLNLNDRWLVREVKGKKQGWVPCQVLQSIDDPVPGGAGLPGDAAFRRQAVVNELVETEQEFVKDLDYVVQKYLIPSESGKVPKVIKDNFEVVFSNLKEISEFHKTVLMEGVKYHANEPLLLGKTFLRLERDFDKHVVYCRDEPLAQEFLEQSDAAFEYFEELSQRLGDDKSISEHLKLPIQRINDYQLLLKELVRYSACLGENNQDLKKALDLMLSVPHRAQDDKFTSSIEGYRGSIHKLGRLLAHDRFSVTFGTITKERYLFLFKARILICKVRKISDDRSIFQLKDIVRLNQVVLKDHPEDETTFEFVDKVGGQSLLLKAHRESIKQFWIQEISAFAQNFGEAEERDAEEFRIESPPSGAASEQKSPPIKTEPVDEVKRKSSPKKDKKELSKLDSDSTPAVKKQKTEVSATETTKKEVTQVQKTSREESQVQKTSSREESQVQKTSSIEESQVQKTSSRKESTVVKAQQVQSVTEQHLDSIKAVEPLIQVNKPRVLEEVVPYEPKPEVKGSALKKVYSVEPIGQSDIVLTDYHLGVEVNVEVDDMSKRYTTSRAEGYSDASYSRRTADASYTSDGVSSSRYAEQGSSRYGSVESSSDPLSKYGRSTSYSSDIGDGTSIRRSGDADSYSHSRRSTRASLDDEETSKRTKSRFNSDLDDDLYSSYSKRSIGSTDFGDGDNYTYSRRSIKTTTQIVGDGDNYSIRKAVRTSDNGTGLESVDTTNLYSYSTRQGLSESDSRASKKSLLSEDGDSIRNKYRKSSEDEEDTLSKYSKTYSRLKSSEYKPHDEEEDIYSKLSRKYSRSGSSEQKIHGETEYSTKTTSGRKSSESHDEEENLYSKLSRKYSRKDSTLEEPEEAPLKVRKYSRTESVNRTTSIEEDPYEKYAKKYLRTDSSSKENVESLRTQSANDTKEEKEVTISGSTRESLEKCGEEMKAFARQDSESSSVQETTKTSVNESQVQSEVKQTTKTESISTSKVESKIEKKTLNMSEEKTATEKVAEITGLDDKPHFIKTMRGTNVEPGDSAHFEVLLNDKPTNFTWLKDNKPVTDDVNMTGRIQQLHKNNEYKLIVRQVDQPDTGLYTALATNDKGKASCSAQLIVHELTPQERAERAIADKPEFLISLKDTEMLEDTYLRFMVKVGGDPNPEVAFFKDGVKIMETSDHFQVVTEHSDKGFYELVIPTVRKTDAGLYKCTATNKFGEASSEARVLVTENKKIFADMPEGEILPAGEKPNFQWKKDGVSFEPEERFKVLMGDDEDSLALVFQKVRPEDVGLYTCVAQTSRGHISCSAELTVHGTVNQLFREPEKPTLVIEKRDPIVTAGGSAMLELQIKGYPKPNVTFSRNGKQIEAGGKYKFLYEDDENMSLVIKNVQSEDGGEYQITAENELGTDIQSMKLTVKAPPKIKCKMEDVSSHADELLKMTVELEGTPAPTIQFFKDGKEVKQSERVKIVQENEKHILVVEKTSISDSGTYSIVATNEMAQVSQFWKLDVYSKPKVLEKLGNDKQVSQGEKVQLKVKLQAEPKPEVKWYKDEEEIKSNDHFSMKEEGDSYILNINGAVVTDAARYKFKAVNVHGTIEDDVKVDVKKVPKVTKGLEDRTVTEHDKNITFDVKVESFPKPTVTWYLDEVEIKETRTEFTRSESEDGVKLVIKEVTSQLSGQYKCKLSNECGTTETTAKLTVNCAPKIIKQLKDTTVVEGATLHLEVEASGCPSPTVKWLRNGREVSADARIKITRDSERKETYNLSVDLIKYEEQGEYEVIVTNTLGTVSSKSFVTVHKVVHSDAIEESGKPPLTLKVETSIDQPEVAQVTQESNEGSNQCSNDSQSPQPIVEEPVSPIKKQSIKIEESAFLKPESKSMKKASSVEIEEIEPKDLQNVQSKNKINRGCSLEIAEVVTNNFEETQSKKLCQSDTTPASNKTQKGTVSLKEEMDIIELESLPQLASETSIDDSKKTKQLAMKSDVEENNSTEADGKRNLAETLNKENTENAHLDLNLQEAKLVGPEAIPIILDTNMKDGSRPESLDVTYIVKGFSNPLPMATWSLNGKEIVPDGHLRMTTSQNGDEFQLEIKKLELKDAGKYECVLSNPLGKAASQAVLEVTAESDLRRPKIKEGLKDQTIIKKNSLTYKAVIIGDPIPEVTWFKGGKEITQQEFDKSKIVLENEDHEIEDGLKECTYSLTIPKCDRSNAGHYSIKAKNKWGECESSAQLTIILQPEIEGPKDVSAVPGEATEFTVVIQSNPVPEVEWTKDGQVVKAGELIRIVADVDNETYKLIFDKVLLGDDGYYQVTAKNHLGSSSSEARLKAIKEAEPTTDRPKFITGLSDEHVQHLGEFSVMVRADGLPKPEITWYKNGKELVQDEHHKIVTVTETQVISTFTLSNYGENDEGTYKVVAKNVVGEAETSARIGMLQTPPTFGKKLDRTAEVNEYDTLELKAKIVGSPKPTIVWYKDGEPLAENPRISTVLQSDGTVKLTIDKADPNDSGAYKLVVRNANGETACLCAVAVTQKPRRPKFLKCFKDVQIPLGEPLRLEAKIEAYPPPEIKWMKDGLHVRPSSNVHFEHHPDGRIALIVDAAKLENTGNYEVIVTNKLGEALGDAKVVCQSRPTKPEFVVKLVPQTVVEGFPVKFEVKAVGLPAPTIQWSRNGVEVISDQKHIKISDLPDGVSVLLLDAADEARDALTYRAIASNDAGEAETSAILHVKPAVKTDVPEERPVLLHALKETITDEGQPLVLEAPFVGNPIPTVEWTKDGEPIEPSDRVLMTCDGRRIGLRIDSALPSDAGIYGVTLVNPLGTEKSQAKATVHKVFQPPSFTQKFIDLQQLPDRDAKFPCRVIGVPQPDVVWSKDGEPIRETDKFRIKRDGDACCLYVTNCDANDAGVYRATATNKEGQDICTATLEVVKEIKTRQKIEPPVFLKRIGDTELFKSMTAKFTACASGIPEPTVEWFHNDKKLFPSNRIKMDRDQAGLLRLTISGVDMDDLGKYSCKISNEHGNDICHATLKFDEGLEPKSKRNITDQYTEFDRYKRTGAPMPIADPPIISQMTDRHCTLSWKPSIPSGPRVPVTYILEMCELPQGDWFTVRTGIRSCTCGVRNLEPFRDYKFRIRVENKYGLSDPSPYAITHREKLELDVPKFQPYLPPEIDFRPDTSPYFPRDFDIERPPHDGMAQAPRFLRQEHDTQYGVKDQSSNIYWFVYGYPKPKVSYYFQDELIEPGGRFDVSYTRNGQATLFINKMLDRDVGWYEAVARNEHGEARQRIRMEISEAPYFLRRPQIEYSMARGRARFEAKIIGVPYPEIKWYKDWKPLASSTRIKIQFYEPDTAVLLINDIIFKDDGLYTCSARNVAGSSSSGAMLYVEENDLEYNTHTYSQLSPLKPKKRLFTDVYDIGDELGRGTQGITYHAVERLNGRNYAAKMMHCRGDLRPFMYNELEMLNELRHRKLVSLHDCYETDDSLILVLELCAGGELLPEYLLKTDYYTESDIAGFIRQTLLGLDYMHTCGYGHMGLNLGDLLLNHPGGDDLKITDFGLTRRISMGRQYALKYGVPEFVSPECANGEGVGFGHDMWSIGIITFILLSGTSPFRGLNDMETLINIKKGTWQFEESWWSRISIEAKDFITKLLVYQQEGRLDVHAALRHPWLNRADKRYTDEFQISSRYLKDYWKLYREWYDNASCRKWFRRRPLEGAFTHPSKMVYPPGEYEDSPRITPATEPRAKFSWEDQLPTRSPLNYEIGLIKSESHYQNGPDTYLLQLRDVDFPCRLREYMKVAANRGPGCPYIVSDENGYDWRTPVIRERRRFTDIMDEEIDDERRTRINRYGTTESTYSIRRLKHELGSRLDTYVEAEAFLESKIDGRLPFFREKPPLAAMQEGCDLELTCLAVGDPQPVVQWFKNDGIVAESHRIQITTDEEGRSHIKFSPALDFDQGMYKIVARNKVGQTIARTRIVLGLVPDEPDSPEASQISDTEVLLTWKQPKFDGNAPVLCYRLDYKQADDMEWTKKADNIDHEFYLLSGLAPLRNYIFRLAAKNRIGWSEPGVPTAPITTKSPGEKKIQLSKAMLHLQQITEAGQSVEEEPQIKYDYTIETDPVVWRDTNVQECYNFISEIARGQFSTVLKGVDKRSDTVVVAKILELGERQTDVEGEFAALRSLRHERIASLLAAYRTNDTGIFILEKLQGSDILTYLASRHEYTEQMVATIVSQILDGLQYLHWRGLCHLDLQPDNIVMCGVRSVQIKLVDLGSAHRVTKLGTKVPIVGHPDYISPEVLSEELAHPQTDMWTVGVLTYMMLSGTVPFRGADINESRQNILFVRYRFEHLYQEISQEATRFLMMVFKRQPNKRPTPEECHENRWLLPTDYMIKKRERAVFLGHRIKEYSEEYHGEKEKLAKKSTCSIANRMMRSQSIQEELLTAP